VLKKEFCLSEGIRTTPSSGGISYDPAADQYSLLTTLLRMRVMDFAHAKRTGCKTWRIPNSIWQALSLILQSK
jgi:hypothetical protein